LGTIYSLGNYRKNLLKSNPYDPLIDGKKAMEWYQKAADLGDGNAMWHLGGIYYEGRFTTQNYREALRWYERAAETGSNTPGPMLLGEMFESKVPDGIEAYKWYSIMCADSKVPDCL
jgi:TPR repeat protein